MEWMLDIQLGRRNLSPIQRIAVAEKYRPIYERQAAINKSLNEGDKKSESVNLPTPIAKIDVREKLASVAGVSGKTGIVTVCDVYYLLMQTLILLT